MPQILRGIICSVEVAAVAARANARERMRYIIMRWLGGARAKQAPGNLRAAEVMAARAVRLLIINGTLPFRTLPWAPAASPLSADVLLPHISLLTFFWRRWRA
jgi:hypothetical protein